MTITGTNIVAKKYNDYKAASLLTCPAWQKLVVILLDEMHIREDLVYNKHTGKMVGFCDLGEVNNLMLQFERLVEGNSDRRTPLANSMMVLSIRDRKWTTELTLFSCDGTSAKSGHCRGLTLCRCTSRFQLNSGLIVSMNTCSVVEFVGEYCNLHSALLLLLKCMLKSIHCTLKIYVNLREVFRWFEQLKMYIYLKVGQQRERCYWSWFLKRRGESHLLDCLFS